MNIPVAGRISRRESRLAYTMIMPTFFMVMALVLFPLLSAFWISVKPINLADLRPAKISVRKQIKGEPGKSFLMQYRLRNTSRDLSVENILLTETLPPGVKPSNLDSRCNFTNNNLRCELGTYESKASETLKIDLTVEEDIGFDIDTLKEKEPQLIYESPNPILSKSFTIENFVSVFDESEFSGIVFATFFYTFFGTGGASLLGLFAALLLNKEFRGKTLYRGLLLFPYVSPIIAVAFTWVVLFDPFSGTLNALLKQMGAVTESINFFGAESVPFNIFGLEMSFPMALTMVTVFEAWRYFPLTFLFVLARMQAVGSDMYEAADMDGATIFQKFWRLSLPQLIGVLSVLFLLRFIWTFNKFDDIFLLTGGSAGTRTLTVQVYEQAFALNNLGAGAAVAVVVFFTLAAFSALYILTLPKGKSI